MNKKPVISIGSLILIAVALFPLFVDVIEGREINLEPWSVIVAVFVGVLLLILGGHTPFSRGLTDSGIKFCTSCNHHIDDHTGGITKECRHKTIFVKCKCKNFN